MAASSLRSRSSALAARSASPRPDAGLHLDRVIEDAVVVDRAGDRRHVSPAAGGPEIARRKGEIGGRCIDRPQQLHAASHLEPFPVGGDDLRGLIEPFTSDEDRGGLQGHVMLRPKHDMSLKAASILVAGERFDEAAEVIAADRKRLEMAGGV
ncbi:MAG: hypothetical protein ACKOWF_13400, partial [Chloroflexota bacterium]